MEELTNTGAVEGLKNSKATDPYAPVIPNPSPLEALKPDPNQNGGKK
jgi:hypothetical protein